MSPAPEQSLRVPGSWGSFPPYQATDWTKEFVSEVGVAGAYQRLMCSSHQLPQMWWWILGKQEAPNWADSVGSLAEWNQESILHRLLPDGQIP